MLLFLYWSIYIIKQRLHRDLSTLLAGFVFGVILEYINIYLTASYEYSRHFIIQLGIYPNNVPICIALAWGMLLLSAHQLFSGMAFPLFLRTVLEAAFVVSVDLFLDVVAIRLDGGFWIWANAPLAYEITALQFYGISWGNFFGWYAVIFLMSLFMHLFDLKWKEDKWGTLVLRSVFGVIFSEGGLILLLMLYGEFDKLQVGWLLFAVCYFGSLLAGSIYHFRNRNREMAKTANSFSLLLYCFSYLYMLITMILIGICSVQPLFFGIAILYAFLTIFFIIRRQGHL